MTPGLSLFSQSHRVPVFPRRYNTAGHSTEEVRMQPAGSPRILIADDNPQGVELLEAYLTGCDYEVQTAMDGEETLRKVKQWHPDLILLDIMMPKISGFEVCKRLRAEPDTRSIAVIMITALDQPSDIDRAVDVGTDDFLTKPINKTQLLLCVNKLLKSRQYKNDLERALAYIESMQGGEPSKANVRRIAERTYHQVDGVWTDETYQPTMPKVAVKAKSPAYQRIMERHPKMKEVFQLGPNLITVTPSGTALVIAADGKEQLSDADIDKLFTPKK